MTDAMTRTDRPWRHHPAGGIPGGVSDLLRTDRLVIRDWREDDAEAALAVYGDPAVARWLTPAIETVTDLRDMQNLLQRWIAESKESPTGVYLRKILKKRNAAA